MPIEVQLDQGDRIDRALKVFKRKVERSGILSDLRRRRHYMKPSEARQHKAALARRRRRASARRAARSR
jgi:small subunit ribosomal protein S21